eukprot:11197208-Lingulodinium_polyedra.AAC.1
MATPRCSARSRAIKQNAMATMRKSSSPSPGRLANTEYKTAYTQTLGATPTRQCVSEETSS